VTRRFRVWIEFMKVVDAAGRHNPPQGQAGDVVDALASGDKGSMELLSLIEMRYYLRQRG
jgi:hypothetical protein